MTSCVQPFTASESNYTGQLKAMSSNTNVATVSPAQGNGPSTQFLVSPVAAGTTSITVTDSNGQSATVSVTVTTTPIIIQSRNRKGN